MCFFHIRFHPPNHTFLFKYSAFCLFPFILPGFAPTAVPPVLPFCSRFRAFPSLPLSFVRFSLVLTTQPSVLSFPFFPFSPVGGSSGASFLFRPACFHAFLPIPVLSFLHFLSPLAVSPHSGYLSASAFSFRFRPFPLGFRFRFWLLGFTNVFLSETFDSLCLFVFPQRTSIYYHRTFYLSTPFSNFFKNFYFFVFYDILWIISHSYDQTNWNLRLKQHQTVLKQLIIDHIYRFRHFASGI